MTELNSEQQIESLAALGDPLRRSLYSFVVRQGRDVSRDEAAVALDIARPLAAFHLDKLVKSGLLQHRYRRLGDRRGPGAGRPSKVYFRSQIDFTVTLPPRRFKLAASILASALLEVEQDAQSIVERVAFDRGRSLAESRRGERLSERESDLELLLELLTEFGFEPKFLDGALHLQNSPFRGLGDRHIEDTLIWSLVDGLAAGLDMTEVSALSDPASGRVRLSHRVAAPESVGASISAP